MNHRLTRGHHGRGRGVLVLIGVAELVEKPVHVVVEAVAVSKVEKMTELVRQDHVDCVGREEGVVGHTHEGTTVVDAREERQVHAHHG